MQKYLKWGYLIAICTFLPLYMKNGYYELGEAKGILFMVLSSVFVLTYILSDIRNLFKGGNCADFQDFAAFVFLFSNVLTFIFSKDKTVSFFGLIGWRCGFLSLLLMILVFLIFKNEKQELFNVYILAALMVTPVVEEVMCILERTRIVAPDIYGKDSTFLATIGNINWLVGYLSIFVPVSIGIVYCQKTFSKRFFFAGVAELVGLLALVLQGSDSGLLVILGSFILLLFVSLSSRDEIKKFWVQLFILGLAFALVDIMISAGIHFNYENNLSLSLCMGHIGIILMALSFFLYRLTRFFEEIKGKWRGTFYRYVLFLLLFILCGTLAIMLFKNYDLSFGNARAVIWSITLDIFRGMSPWEKLVGVGQDGFYGYAYSRPDIAEALLNTFPGLFLTNAHCEPLTMLIERGMLGVLSYFLFVGTAIFEFYQNKRKYPEIICVLPVAAYLINSLVSFSTPVSTPYMFIALGILSYLNRQSISQKPE